MAPSVVILVPGNEDFNTVLALTDNRRVVKEQIVGTGYYNTWCNIKPNTASNSAFIKKNGGVLRVPIAHAEGRFVVDKNIEGLVNEKNLITYQYCNHDGEVLKDFPTNPNSSFKNAAAISNLSGNVMAMMPHPERMIDELISNKDGQNLFLSLIN